MPSSLASPASSIAAAGGLRSFNNRNPWDGRMQMLSRCKVLKVAAAGAASAGSGSALSRPLAPEAESNEAPTPSPALPEATRGEAILDALPGKKPLIKLAYRPPNYETPVSYFRKAVTPSDAFFVRYHLSDIPNVDARSWKL